MNYRYSLQRSAKKNYCPSCQKKTFVNYFDNYNKEVLPSEYGRCDREVKCSYHLSPYHRDYALLSSVKTKENNSIFFKKIDETLYYFDFETYKKAMKPDRFIQNTFLKNLIKFQNQSSVFIEKLFKVVDLYKLGTVINNSWKGAVTFPFIDLFGNIRAVQVKKFNEKNSTIATNKLDKIIISQLNKEHKPIPEWLKKHVEYGDEFGYFTCLFGEHLLSLFPENPIALFEAPKTAIYGSLYFGLPMKKEDFIFLAVYNKSSFSFEKIKILEGRKVYVFPDLSEDGKTFNEWKNKANEFEKKLCHTSFIFSDFLEKFADLKAKKEGNDLADFLIKMDYQKLNKNHNINDSTISDQETVQSIEELKELAEKIIGKNNSLKYNEIPNIEQLVDKQIIKYCHVNNSYYLKNSTPF